MKVGYAGEPGAFGEQAARAVRPDAEPVPLESFEAVARAVRDGAVEAGVIPVENAIAGAVREGMAAVLTVRPPVCGEARVRVRHLLLGPPGMRLEEVTRVHSHPQALAQCRRFLEARGLEAVPESNTATAARRIAEGSTPGSAAIASRAAAERYGLAVLAEGIADEAVNETRFYVLGELAGGPERRVRVVVVPGRAQEGGDPDSGKGLEVPVHGERSRAVNGVEPGSPVHPSTALGMNGGAPRPANAGHPSTALGMTGGDAVREIQDGALPAGAVLLGRLARAPAPDQTDATASTSS